MLTFEYKGISAGKYVEGDIEAINSEDAAFKLKNQANKYPSSSIIINGANEILVDQFLLKKIPFLAIPKIIMTILNDRNYRKYAIKKPLNINQINKIDFWAKKRTKEIIKINYD